MAKRIIIAGGGTGGHIFPALAIANALKKKAPELSIMFVGAKGRMEMEKIPQAGYPIEGIDIAGFNRSSLIRNIGLPWLLIKSFVQVKRIISSFKPQAVIGVGGYSSFPVLRYAQAKNIPSFIHESNSFAGKSNILLGKKAVKVFVASDGMERFFPKEKLMITGNPVRSSIVNCRVTREEGLKFFGLDAGRQTILAIGGSLGAKSINGAIETGLPVFEQNDLQLIWQTGKQFTQGHSIKSKGYPWLWINEFIDQMDQAFAAADIVISRAGAMTIAELCVMGKATIFVPFPFAAEDHQTVNAQNLVNKNAGILIKDAEVNEKLMPTVFALSKDERKKSELMENIKRLARTDADEVIAEEILRFV
ncbi:MAG: undecaprenyldiphospho-muramoylpentapeptide beta-N-acetylglucosaminyltransferase [Chitinophagales bacterium]